MLAYLDDLRRRQLSVGIRAGTTTEYFLQ